MPRPGPRPYECVRRAWHSERHQPMRGSLIQELFRVANELHNPATRKNKEWQQKLPFVVLKAEEIMYSKANSEAEYMDLTTLLDRAKDAIDTIIRRDESEETGDLLEPCIEAALNLGCVPRRASRSQRHNSPRCYLTPASQQPPPPPSQPLEPPRNLSSPGSTPAGNLGSPYHHHHGPYSRLSLPVATQLPTNPPPPGTNPQQQQQQPQPPPPPQHCSFQFPSRYQAFRQMPHHSSAGHCGGSAPVTVRFAGPSPTMIHEHANSFMPLSRGGGGFPYPASPLEHARVTQDRQRHQQFLFPRTEPRSNPCPYSGQNRAYTQYYIPSPNCQSTGLQQLPTPQNVGRCDYAGGAAPGGLGPPCTPRSGFLYNFLSSDSNKGGGPQEEEPPLCVGSVSENTHATESFDLSLRLGRSSDQGFSGSWNQEVDDQSSSCSYGQGKLRDLNCPPISL